MNNPTLSRRAAVKSSVFGLLAASIPGVLYAKQITDIQGSETEGLKLFQRYPSIDDEIVSEVVGKSHFNLERVKELVDHRTELARATWDWGFGDWESALGAASHVGRHDIANYLISKGARPNIYTLAMLGKKDAVKAMIEAYPGIQRIPGPHGINLIRHAKAGSKSEDLSDSQKNTYKELIGYLEKLGDANFQEKDIELSSAEKENYLGDYKYGDGEKDGFSVKLNMRDMLCLGKLGQFGGALYQQIPGEFTYNGITSVKITFEELEGRVISLTVNEPGLILKANKL